MFFVSQSITLPPVSSIALARYLTKTKFSIDVLAKLGKENVCAIWIHSGNVIS